MSAPAEKTAKKITAVRLNYPVAGLLAVLLFLANGFLLFFLYRQNRAYLRENTLFQSQEKLREQGFTSQLMKEAGAIGEAFLGERQMVEFISAVDSRRPLFEKFILKFETPEPIVRQKQRSIFFVLEFSGPVKEVSRFIQELIGSSCQVKVASLRLESKDLFVNKADVQLRAELFLAE